MDILSIVEVSFSVVLGVFLFLGGAFTLLGYMILRMLRSDSWDDSNMTNALRLISHMVVHPNDFGKMYYLKEEHLQAIKEQGVDVPKRPFYYTELDELSEVVNTRPE